MEHLDHPSLDFNDAKMARFCSFAPSSLLWGRRGIIVLFYSVQDCSLLATSIVIIYRIDKEQQEQHAKYTNMLNIRTSGLLNRYVRARSQIDQQTKQ